MNYYICVRCGSLYCGWAISKFCQKCGGLLKAVSWEEFYSEEKGVVTRSSGGKKQGKTGIPLSSDRI